MAFGFSLTRDEDFDCLRQVWLSLAQVSKATRSSAWLSSAQLSSGGSGSGLTLARGVASAWLNLSLSVVRFP